MAKKSPFIVIDGGEGSGKSTLLAALKEKYPKALFTREPGGSLYGEEIRNLLLYSKEAMNAPAVTKLLLFYAARADHMKNRISLALAEGKMVITDRFDASSYAYQIFGEDKSELEKLFFVLRKEIVMQCRPTAYIFLDVDPEVGLSRKNSQEKEGKEKLNYFDRASLDFHNKIRNGYKKFFKKIDEKSYIINANQPLEVVKKELFKVIKSLN
jgi:dTMP kinase